MSLDVAREEHWGTTARRTIRERCEFMFNNELLSDIKFVARESSQGGSVKKIPAHKFLLAISSPVFFAMFYGELAEKKDSIDVSDCEYESLLELFRFIYSDEVNLNPDNVMQVLYLAKKYLLPALADKCTEYLRENLDASNAFHVLPDAQKYEEKDLVANCWEVIDEQTDEAVKSEGFVTIERSVLEELVERDSLTIMEVELFKAVDCWAAKECEKQGVAAEGSMKRRILGERIVKGIRFPVMEQKEFASVVLDCDILTKKESFDMVKYFSSVLNVPVEFSEATRAGSHKRISRFQRFESDTKSNGWHYISDRCNAIILSVDKNIKLYSVCLFGSENNEYSFTIRVSYKDSGVVLATKTGKFLSKLVESEKGVYHGFDIALDPPLALKAHSKYCFKAYITGPPSMYGKDGLSRVEHAGVTISFMESGSPTTVKIGQFSEFEFTLN